MTVYNQSYLEYVRSALRGKMDAHSKPTNQSLIYRKRAADLARAADSSTDMDKQVELIKQALQWIELAENEEFLAIHPNGANDN